MSPWSRHSAIGVTPFRPGRHDHEGFHDSPEYERWAAHVTALAGELGLPVVIENVTGSWGETTEPSALIRLGSREPELVDHFAATVARAGRQRAVVRFVPDRDGPDVAYRFELAGIERERLERSARLVADLPGASLEISELTLHVLGPRDVLEQPIAEMARLLGEPRRLNGHFALIEVSPSDGAGTASRDGAVASGPGAGATPASAGAAADLIAGAAGGTLDTSPPAPGEAEPPGV